MKSALKIAGLVVGLTLAAGAHAEGMYMGVNYARTNGDTGGFGTIHPSVLFANIGTEFNKNFAVEGRLGTGMSDDTIVGVKVKFDSYYGLYLKGLVPLSDTVTLYGLIGESHAGATASAGTVSASASSNSSSFGIGGSYAINKNVSINLEWARLFKDTDAISVGVGFRF